MSVPNPVLEGVRQLILRLAAAFPATPQVDYPDPGELWPTRGGVGRVVIVVNKTGVNYKLSVRDLTASVDIPTPACPAPPVPSTFTLAVNGLTSGNDYRVRIEVDPAEAQATDEINTVYVTAV